MADQDKRELLRSMLNGLINDKPEEASMDLHSYLTAKMRDIAGLDSTTEIDDAAGDEYAGAGDTGEDPVGEIGDTTQAE